MELGELDRQYRRERCDDCPEQVRREYDRPGCKLIQGGAPCAYTQAVEQGHCPLGRWPLTAHPAVKGWPVDIRK